LISRGKPKNLVKIPAPVYQVTIDLVWVKNRSFSLNLILAQIVTATEAP
jgi:hypothetical protein